MPEKPRMYRIAESRHAVGRKKKTLEETSADQNEQIRHEIETGGPVDEIWIVYIFCNTKDIQILTRCSESQLTYEPLS